ncbi:MAG: RNA polymerase sigma factor [Ruminococcus sp.]|nr:RNA polymerase sigma factor [Ruminococcus sp.]
MITINADEMAKIYDKHKNSVYRMAFTYCKNASDAEDIMQDVFMKRFASNIVFDDESKEKSWMLKITVNMCKDMFRSLRYKYSLSAVPLEEAELVYETTEESDVYNAVMNLKPKYRLIIHLYYYEGYSIKEISKITDKSESAIQTILYRARNQLKIDLGRNCCYEY